MNEDTIEDIHKEMVRDLVKSPEQLHKEIEPADCALLHAVLGIASEAGELLDAIKKAVIYRKPIDRDNIVEELGDLEFYMQDLRQRMGIYRLETLKANVDKLSKRYPNFVYSDQRAQERADKQAPPYPTEKSLDDIGVL